ncbi:hypothetical protein MAM1_0128c06039 [Mucor ambiguus]|uniref:Protein Zds1 C-terminal domain-containing protein n=1 Tax=Mucor ambiguus TaxID=91626 RepID=A0A0C9MGV8_9FUNG|nr:hypothetical protein MAM1_0128c06039 [Mucor ambiguus]
MIHIKSIDEINALNQHEIISAQSSEIAHTKANTVASRMSTGRKKANQIAPNDFEQWIESHGGDKDFVDLINTRVTPRKRRSLLSNVSFAYSSDESSNSEEEEDDFNTPTVVARRTKNVVKGDELKQALTGAQKASYIRNCIDGSPSDYSATAATTPPPKPPIHKTHEPVPVPLTNKTVNISQFFSNKKKPTSKPKEQAKKIPNLPKRYPIPIERVIYEISWMKLNNPRRPMRHHVSIFNLLAWYTNMVDNRQTLLYLQIPPRSTSSHVSAGAVSRPY